VVDAVLEWLIALPAWATYLALALLSALENVFPPVPADVAVALGAFLAQRGEISAVLIGIVCWSANFTTSAGMYFLGRTHGRSFFGSGWPSRLLPPESMRALQEIYDKHGVLGIFVSRFLPGIRAAVTPFAGVADMPPLRALVPAGAASAIWYALLVSAGYGLGREWETVRALVDRVNQALGIVGLLAAIAFVLWFRARRRKHA
jgi:membrane protein DedA with SNARE-associated domain